MKRLSDGAECVIKRCRRVSSLSTSAEINEPEEETIINEQIISLDSENNHNDDDDIIEIIYENKHSTCEQIDTRIIMLSDSDSDDDQIIDITDNNILSITPIINILLSSPLNDLVGIIEDNEINIENVYEVIDLTDDESNSTDCLSNKLEHQSSIDSDQCPICLETLTDLQYTGVDLIITQCNHIMCTLCSRQLLATSSQCPLCRNQITLYNDGKDEKSATKHKEESDDQVAVIRNSTFSVMSKVKFDLASVITVQLADTSSFLDIKTREVLYNPKFEDMYAPVFSPTNPNLTQQQRSFKKVLNGYAESITLSDFQFENQRRTFDSFGYAVDSSVGEDDIPQMEEQKEIDEYLAKKPKAKRPTLENRNALVSARDPESTTLNEEPEDSSSTTLEIKDPYDYQGRSCLHMPQDVGVNLRSEHGPQQCFISKQCIHIYKGHIKAVQNIHYFPVSAHFFLTCSMDSKVKVRFYNERRCIRTYAGHRQAVRDVNFYNTGTEFLSVSYDNMVKYSMRKIPYCVSFNSSEHKQHLFICGMSDKKIFCFDIRSGHVVQEYDRH
ncbi:unnamed protein product [Rotaria sp. Silwood1]|nr:unnamed protein product [Rotaria sp. Silwood1]